MYEAVLASIHDRWFDAVPRSALLAFALAALVVLDGRPASATKPCPASPCDATGGGVDLAKCEALADWVATGTISGVAHHEQGSPLFKDFAEFTFTVASPEKGAVKAGQVFKFQVGWCENTRPLPKDTSGTFRVYGKPIPKDPSVAPEYLDFEPLESGLR